MQRLRSTFKRSRTPTGAEMKSQSSLEVPKQVRSASFDEIQLEVQRSKNDAGNSMRETTMNTRSARTSSSSSSCSPARSQDSPCGRTRRLSTLRVPQLQNNQRSKSFDVYERHIPGLTSTGSLQYNPQPRQSSTTLVSNSNIYVPGCYHCACVEEYRNHYLNRDNDEETTSRDGDDETNEDEVGSENEEIAKYQASYEKREEEDEEDEEDGERRKAKRRDGSPEIRVTLSDDKTFEQLSSESDAEFYQYHQRLIHDGNELIPERRRRRSSISKLSRQEALTCFPIETIESIIKDEEEDERKPEQDQQEQEQEHEEDDDDDEDDNLDSNSKCKLVVREIFLTVPELKRDRAASVDSCFNNNKNGKIESANLLDVPQQSVRSKSVDIVLPTEAQTRYTALLPGNEPRPRRGASEEGGSSSGNREPRSTPDWGRGAINGEHFWVPTAASGDFCYANECNKHGHRMKCSACRVVAHAVCAGGLKFDCKTTFGDAGVRQYREQTQTDHHWVHRRSQKGKCTNCGKSFQSKLSFSSKEMIAVSCSWCKTAYHNKEACFGEQKIHENCKLGIHSSIIVPPSWIVKLPGKGSFKSSLRKSPRRKKSGSGSSASARRKSKEKDKDKEEEKGTEKEKEQDKFWIIKPIPTTSVSPVLVFINPKSGGNQGAKLLQKFQWLLNPRQVFDLTQGGPKMGLEMFKNVPNLRVLACGGDGTVGWVLSILDLIKANPPPSVGVLPLGTGNDLARALGWGGGYTDEPIGKILMNIGESETILLDRWQLLVEKNPDAQNDDDGGKGKENLPLNVVNNYFSLGVDAQIALEFHEAREAHPEKFNSRLRNKIFYGQMGGKDLVRPKWKELSEFVTLECDGQDMTSKLKEHRVHAIVFLNIASYGGGTRPWNTASGTREPSTEDGLIEVVGLTTYQLPLLQAGGHGTCIAQCSKAKLVTMKTIPMQVDGEACRLLPSIIDLSLLNKAPMLAKRRSTSKPQKDTKLERLKLPVMKIKMSDYETYHSEKDALKATAVSWLAELDLDATTDLESLRKIIAKEHNMDSCCFLDSCTAERFFRIDRAQEQLHYVTDVAVEAVYILEEESTGNASSTNRASTSGDRKESKRTNTTEGKSRSPKSSTSDHSAEKKNKTEEKGMDKINKESSANSMTRASNDRLAEEERTKVQDNGPASRIQSQQESIKSKEPLSKTTSQTMSQRKRFEQGDLHREHIDREFSRRSGPSKPSSTTFISSRERLFSLSSEVHTFSTGLLEKTSDGILKAGKIGDLRSLRQLHEEGYSLLSIDSTGQTALHLAAKLGHENIVRYLITCAPSSILNMVDNDKGQTALHKAAQQKRRTICCMLVASGATLTVQDRSGNTPRQLALAAEDRELAAYLHSQTQFQLVAEEGMSSVL